MSYSIKIMLSKDSLYNKEMNCFKEVKNDGS